MSKRRVIELSRGTQSNLMFCVSYDPQTEDDYRVFVGDVIAADGQKTVLRSCKLLKRGDQPRCMCHGRVYTIVYNGQPNDLDLVEGCELLDPNNYNFDESQEGMLVTVK